MSKDGGWILPEVADPEDYISVCVPVPNTREHRTAFAGALYELTYWRNWQRDEAHTAKDVSEVWRGIFHTVMERLDALEGCEVPSIIDIRNEDCTLEVRYSDNPEVWVAIGQFLPLDASCDLTDDLTIIKSSGSANPTALTLRHDGYTGAAAGVQMFLQMLTSDEVARIGGRIGTVWNNNTPGAWDGHMRFETGNISGTRLSLQLNSSNAAATIRRYAGQIGLLISSVDAGGTLFQAAGVTGGNRVRLFENGRNERSIAAVSANGTTEIERFVALATGVTPGDGFGQSVNFEGHTSALIQRLMARVAVTWGNATDAAREAELSLRVSNWGGEVTPLRISNHDGSTAIAVHGSAPMTKPTLSSTDVVGALNDLLAQLHAYGWINDATDIAALSDSSAGFGDVNEPPAVSADPCASANRLAEITQNTVIVAFDGLTVGDTALEIYNYFRLRFGFKLDELHTFAAVVEANLANEATILTEIEDSMADYVIAIYDADLDQAGVISWILGYSGYTAFTAVVLGSLVASFTLAKWREEAHLGVVAGSDEYDCIACAGGGPVEGEFVVQWTGANGGLAADWETGVCGDGFTSETNCDGENAALYISFDIPSPPALTLEFVHCEIEITYDLDGSRNIGCSMSAEGDTLGTPSANLSGVGSHTFVSNIGIITTNTGQTLTVSVVSNSAFNIGDEYTIVSIRVEGNGNNFAHNGDEC